MLFKNGFLGVDIFFVISGYLISKNLYIQYLETNKIKYLDFYKKRFLRIYPALLSTIAISSILVLIIYPHHLVENYLLTALAAIFSVSNILFFRQSGYFDEESSFKPLLHTWSLGVEEQFYIFFPLIFAGILFIAKSSNMKILVILALVLLSLMLNLVSQNDSLNFYFMPMRIYEFLLGVLIVFLEDKFKSSLTLPFSILLLVSIFLPIFFNLSENSFAKILPNFVICSAASLIILYKNNNYIQTILSFHPLVSIGNISYSLYLVHWPIIVLTKYIFGPITLLSGMLILISCYFAAKIQFQLVEKRFKLK